MSTNLFKRISLILGLALVIIFIAVLAKPLHVNAETSSELGTWSLSNQVPYQLQDISMVSPLDGWAVGYEGYVNASPVGSVLMHWDGSAWNRLTSPTSRPLYAVKMISATDGWAVGKYGARWHWDGSTWSDFTDYADFVGLYDIDFTSANDVWAVGYDQSYDGKIEHWDGSTWSSFSGPGCQFRSVSAISADDVWIVGQYAEKIDYVWYYHPLRAHWDGSIWTVTIIAGNNALNDVDMVSSNEGWDVGRGILEHYTGSWEIFYSDPPVGFGILISIEMLSATDGWIVGGPDDNDYGVIFHWDGINWTVIDNPASRQLISVDMLSTNEGWAVGRDGIILHYTNYTHISLPLVIR
jgi:photosystem II stability/assembly factor-like uncharacterized protein